MPAAQLLERLQAVVPSREGWLRTVRFPGKPTRLIAGTVALGCALCDLSTLGPLGLRKKTARQGRRGEQLRSLVENAPDVVLVLENDFTVSYASPSVYRVLGYRPEEFAGTRLSQYLHQEGLEQLPAGLAEKFEGSRTNPSTPVELFEMRHADGSRRCLEATSAALPDEQGAPRAARRAYYLRDVSERKAIEEDLAYQAFHDPLTGLANRSLFMDRLAHALARVSRQQKPIGVLFIDLDDFKVVNDSLGHGAGDELLVTTGQRLQECLRPADTAARLGGDEFAALVTDVNNPGEVTNIAERVVETLRAPVALDDRTLSVTASVGVALGGFGGFGEQHRVEDLLCAADIAMYRAKATGKSNYAVFRKEERPPLGRSQGERSGT